MLARLRHHAFVGGDDEKGEVDAGRAGEHRPHESLVTGDVDDADRPNAVDLKWGETQLDRYATALLLREPIGVDPGEGAHQCRLAVIAVPGGSENHVATSAARGDALSGSCSHISKARS